MGKNILSDLSLDITGGKTTVILGAIGCGKSTLMKIMDSIIPPDKGEIFYFGEPARSETSKTLKEFRRRNGFVFQDGALWANKTIYQNLILPLQFHFPKMKPDEINSKVDKLLKRLDFKENINQRPSDTSWGNRKIISFIRAIICDPDIIFIDSPFESVDPVSKEKIKTVIKELKNENKTIIMSTYDPEITSVMADRLILLKDGKVLADGDYSEIIKSDDPEIIGMLSHIINRAPSYDSDILDLLEQ